MAKKTCSICGKEEATVRLTVVVNGQKQDMFVCEGCAQEKGVEFDDETLEHVSNIVAQELAKAIEGIFLSPQSLPKEAPKCPKCGITLEQIVKTAKFGCEHDYEFFGDTVVQILKRVHGGMTEHVGKVPQRTATAEVKIELLKKEMDAAVNREQYEKAAELRDQIKELEEHHTRE